MYKLLVILFIIRLYARFNVTKKLIFASQFFIEQESIILPPSFIMINF